MGGTTAGMGLALAAAMGLALAAAMGLALAAARCFFSSFSVATASSITFLSAFDDLSCRTTSPWAATSFSSWTGSAEIGELSLDP